MGFDEESIVTGPGFLANEKFGTFLLAKFDIIVDSVELDFGNLWALVGILVEGVAHFIRLSEFGERLGEFLLDRFMDINPRRRTTNLSLIVKPNIRNHVLRKKMDKEGMYIPL